MRQYKANRVIPDAASWRRREYQVRVQTVQTQCEAGTTVVVVRKQVARCTLRAKLCSKRPGGLGLQVRESASATLRRFCIVVHAYKIYLCLLESESELFVTCPAALSLYASRTLAEHTRANRMESRAHTHAEHTRANNIYSGGHTPGHRTHLGVETSPHHLTPSPTPSPPRPPSL